MTTVVVLEYYRQSALFVDNNHHRYNLLYRPTYKTCHFDFWFFALRNYFQLPFFVVRAFQYLVQLGYVVKYQVYSPDK